LVLQQPPPRALWMFMYFFLGFSGGGGIIMFMTVEFKILMLCFLYFMDNFTIYTLNNHTFLQIYIN
jgi:hypothetical protein